MKTVASNGKRPDGFALRKRIIQTEHGPATLSYLACEPMEDAGFKNAFSTRIGGVSNLPSGSLNLGYFDGDPRENVQENRRRFLEAIGAAKFKLLTCNQTHSTDRFNAKSIDSIPAKEPKCDALTTKAAGVLLAVRTADCLPILIADPKSGVMAAIHAGWRGTAGRIAERTVADMMSLGANARTCLAGLGPVACGECYEVGEDVIERFKQEFGYWRHVLKPKGENKALLDLRAANIQQLEFCGFDQDRIFTAPYCTMHNNDLFFSYRKDVRSPGVGKLLSVVGGDLRIN